MINNIVIQGRLVETPEIKQNSNGKPFSSFRVAVSRNKDFTDFFFCTAYGNLAENLVKYTEKGQEVSIVGQMTSYAKTIGEVHTTNWVVNAVNISYGERPRVEPKPVKGGTEWLDKELDRNEENIVLEEDGVLWD